MDVAALALELRLVRAELVALRQAVEAQLGAPTDPREVEVRDALVLVLGDAPFTTGEALELARRPLGNRPRLRAALLALDCADDAQRAGLVLRRLCRLPGRPRLVALGKEANSRMWQFVGDSGDRAPFAAGPPTGRVGA